MTSVDSNFNFLCGRPHRAGPPLSPVHMRPPEPGPPSPLCVNVINGRPLMNIRLLSFFYESNFRVCHSCWVTNNFFYFVVLFRKLSDGLFLECCTEMSKLYPMIEFENMIIDNTCMQVTEIVISDFGCISFRQQNDTYYIAGIIGKCLFFFITDCILSFSSIKLIYIYLYMWPIKRKPGVCCDVHEILTKMW